MNFDLRWIEKTLFPTLRAARAARIDLDVGDRLFIWLRNSKERRHLGSEIAAFKNECTAEEWRDWVASA